MKGTDHDSEAFIIDAVVVDRRLQEMRVLGEPGGRYRELVLVLRFVSFGGILIDYMCVYIYTHIRRYRRLTILGG